jgi:anthranilate phosphoribosyltransferase
MGGEGGPMRDIALLNAAAGLVIAGKCRELKDGLVLAADAVDSGRARKTLEALIRSSQAAA